MSMAYPKRGVAVVLTMILAAVSTGFVFDPPPSATGRALGDGPPGAAGKPASETAGPLRWRFTVGKTLYQEQTTITKQKMTVMGMEIVQTQRQTFYFSWTPRENKDGNWIIEQRIEGVKTDVENCGNRTQFDSTQPAAAGNPLSDFYMALVGARFLVTVNGRGEVTGIEGRREFVVKLARANPQMQPLLEQILSESALKQMSETAFGTVRGGPAGPLRQGDTWTHKSDLDMGAIGKYANRYTYTYEGKDDGLDRIKVECRLTYTAPSGNAGGLPFKITGADLRSKGAPGVCWFDTARGRVDHSTLHLTLEGKLTIEIGGMPTDVELWQDQKTSVRFTDTSPIKH